MKKLFIIISLFILTITLSSCGGKGCDLLILNWGDYISEDVILAFEEEYDVTVKVATVDSSELMYANVQNKLAEYDLVVPSDYTIDQMKADGLIKEIDFSKLSNYSEDLFVPELDAIMKSDNCSSYYGYYIPYFWGSLGIMYNKRIEGLEEIVKENGWSVLFERDILPKNTKVAMYNVSRDALAAAELYLGYSLNTTNKEQINECMKLLQNTTFDAWGTDDIKTKISQGRIDIALAYSGDYFDAYYADLEADEENVENYSIFAPKDRNNVFFDAMVIPNTCTNEELAYKFLDFIIDFDNSLANAEYVGYCPTIKEVYDEIKNSEDWTDLFEIEAYDPTNIINNDGSIYEVYKYLGSDVYYYLEEEFINVKIH